MRLFERLTELLGVDTQQVDAHLEEITPQGDRHEQAMQIFDHAIAKSSQMEDTPEKLAFVLASLRKGLDLTMQDDALQTAEELKQQLDAGLISKAEYGIAMDNTLDRFADYGGLE